VRKFVPIVPLVFIMAANAFAAPTVLHASAVPEPGILVALGGGLVGLATLVRNHASK
jgi:hypothetical protein